jgi:tRNA(fMet)-specific endonuclease VapC
MNIAVLIEPLPGVGFRVHGSGPFPFTAEGATEEEALENLRKLIRDLVIAGARVVELDVPPYKHPFDEFIGTWKPDESLFEEWMEESDRGVSQGSRSEPRSAMSLYILDTDIPSRLRRGHPIVSQHVGTHSGGSVAVTVLTVEEQLTGWYSLARRSKQPARVEAAYQELAEAVRFFGRWPILSFTIPAMNRFTQLLALRLNVGSVDLKIAAVVLENNGTLVTRNTRDFQRVPNLALEDWSV